MEILNISIDEKKSEYDIYVGSGILNNFKEYLNLSRKVMIVTDENIPVEYIEKISCLSKEPFVVKIKPGEINKNFDNFKQILDKLIEKNFCRTDALIVLGGGVIGDMAGFVASIYMRGIDFYNIPTTLLSMVDSSIGGKTAIDYMRTKNVIGSFYQPKAVIIDMDMLKTLSDRQIINGFVETIKMAATSNENLFKYIEDNINSIEDIYKNLEHIIIESLKIKKDVVEKDTKEQGIRKILNFGHTIGHAIEETCENKFLHGECVGMGMLYFSSDSVKERLKELYMRFNLPFTCEFDKEEAIKLLMHDKKATGSYINVIKVENIGSYIIDKMTIDDIKKMIMSH